MPSQKRPLEDDSLELRGQLATLLNKEVALIGKIRKTDEVPARISVYDVITVITECGDKNPALIWQRIIHAFPEVLTNRKDLNSKEVAHPEVTANCSNLDSELDEKIVHLKFPGRGQRDTPVADLPTIIEIIFLLPGKTAARVRSEAAKLLVRYVGGDMSLVQEVCQMAHVQKLLGETEPDHPLCLFAAASTAMKTHLDAVAATGAVDTTGYGNDPYKLLQRGKLLVGDAGKLKMAMQLKPSVFLRSELPDWQHNVACSILSHFSSELLKRKFAEGAELHLHMNMGRPRVTYFEEDRALMQEVLSQMGDAIKVTVETHAQRANDFLEAFRIASADPSPH